ncbi:MAG: [FeFe] hydrogenase H-cluster radical SAM maturase HydE, partial [Planctomycetes bacterium]|nr:[FeFe] hydrogenase H-cluster radical SAM maturase HydE [Planctomycetota bacterium]
CKMVALARLVCPRANIPSTTALATADLEAGRALGLARGANVVMPNLTPPEYRALYEIYPGKACPPEAAEADADLRRCLASIGRTVGSGPGASANWKRRQPPGGAERQAG